ncbi:hypothetical protein BC827DRAFT_748325 [Russula dissimulans]|nr:hypothetical protein BC827DRAFT_748325 [Russula dissimulans]
MKSCIAGDPVGQVEQFRGQREWDDGDVGGEKRGHRAPICPCHILDTRYGTDCPRITMSTSHHNDVSFPTFQSIFDAASEKYKKKTDRDLRTHPLAAELGHCNSPDAVLLVFQKQADALDQARKSNKTLIKWLKPIIHLLHMFPGTVAEVVGISFSHAKIICTAIGVLLQAAKDAVGSYDVLVDLFERIPHTSQDLFRDSA